MEILKSISRTRSYEREFQLAGYTGVDEWEVGYHYRVLECVCQGVVLTRCQVHTGIDPEYADCVHEVLYPAPAESPGALPTAIGTAYEAALACKRIDANAFATLLGRVLDLICEDRGAEGNTLNERIDCLAARGEIPPKLKEVAHGLRKLRNMGAHANLGSLDAADVPLLEALCKAILLYVYTAPSLVEAARQRSSSQG
jgi:hypothetical protein